ncbi:MAG: 4-hydroxy-3-methylbut-2-enyl diphosphate reductase [Ignavibacteriae bacterium]|nr:4-hydroxy-3-methylbut-2-enyl diphosphate reductase [Ignavibacteriota bacterium]MCB9208448.1 4-hydroxy-3-methylbut-2-enyl diphosphate reductase [Ignavibacteriales bacterium]MCB9258444.1 4-hydroxy-3-methylbut-2-enyl diphosphate reductase [Ignavibacteriales bacterium]
MKNFDIPVYYKSSIIQKIKEIRKERDHYKKDFTPTLLEFGNIDIILARHFGFCFGVENAIEIAYRTIEENPNKKIYLLSEMIHNQGVNADLIANGIEFILDSFGNQIIDWDEITSNDIVIVPAFGTTLETEEILRKRNIDTLKYNTTCPFVEKVWKKSNALGKEDYTVIIHGKANHEETKATFSHAKSGTPSAIVRDIKETKLLSKIILGEIDKKEFYKLFEGKFSEGFDVEKDLVKVGVVNQTTMLASETQEIADCLKDTMIKKYGNEKINNHFADTRDTLCYATNDNQQATLELLKEEADLAVVVGGYNSSNTSHIVELLESKFNTYFISDETKLISKYKIQHFNKNLKAEKISENYLPENENLKIIITSGASCPDSVVESVMLKLLSFYNNKVLIEEAIQKLLNV